MEEWKMIPGTDDRYEVSNLGNVRNTVTGHVLVPRPTKTGYCRVQIPVYGKRKDQYIHRLVASAFCEHPEGKDYVNHLDNDVSNNAADNLEWCTQRDNINYAMIQCRVPNFPNSRVVFARSDSMAHVFRSIREMADYFGCDKKSIRNCIAKGSKFRGYTLRVVN